MHKCIISKLTIIGSDNGLTPGWCQDIIWTNAATLLIGPLETNFTGILIQIITFSFSKMHFKMSSRKWWPFCLGLNVLKRVRMGDISISAMEGYKEAIWLKTSSGWFNSNSSFNTSSSVRTTSPHKCLHSKTKWQSAEWKSRLKLTEVMLGWNSCLSCKIACIVSWTYQHNAKI